jgi:thioredoxin reductase
MLQGMVIMKELGERKIPAHFTAQVKEITAEGVKYQDAEGEKLLKADTVVYATGQKPLTEEAIALSKLAPSFHLIGDVLGPKNILSAVKTAQTIARDIGRF